jgi:hypothetical protein
MEELPPRFPEQHPGRFHKYGFKKVTDIVVSSDGIDYKWHYYEGDASMFLPSVHVSWGERGVVFELSRSTGSLLHSTGSDLRWILRARSEGSHGDTSFEWKRSTWLNIPEAVRRPVERAFTAITSEFERARLEREHIERERAAAREANEAATRKRILEQLEDT